MSTDLDPNAVIAWPVHRPILSRIAAWLTRTPPAAVDTDPIGPGPTVEHHGADDTWSPIADLAKADEPTIGRHRPETVKSVGRGYLLSPAAFQRVTRTVELIPAGPGDATGLLNTPTVPEPTGDTSEVLAELRDAIRTPPEAIQSIDAWVAEGCPIDDQTATEPTADDTPKDPA